MTLAHLLFAASTTAYIVLAIKFEERDLIREHGSSYRSYRAKVPMLMPRLFRRAVAPRGSRGPGEDRASDFNEIN
jgi:hypothetical protein